MRHTCLDLNYFQISMIIGSNLEVVKYHVTLEALIKLKDFPLMRLNFTKIPLL